MNIGVIVLAVVGLGLAAAVPFLITRARWRWRWREVESGRQPILAGDASPYRAAGSVPLHLDDVPRGIQFAAYTCFLFGQMFIPGLLMGMFGLVAFGVGLVSIPGLVTAAKLYSTGFALLRREPRVAWIKAHNAAAWAMWLNGIVFAGSVLIELMPFRATELSGGLGLMLFINAYGALSVLQALYLRRVTARYEDELFAPTRLVRINGAFYQIAAPSTPPQY
jgi:hypothetical protein